jgi:hypothetical protein
MNRTETAHLLTLAAAYDRRTLGEEDVQAWHMALADISYPDARTVVAEHYRTATTWIMPAHIADGVRAIRSERLAGLDQLLPDADPDDVAAWLEAYRAQIAAVADGEITVPAPTVAALARSGGPDEAERDRAGIARVVAALADAKDLQAQADAAERAADQAVRDAFEAERARQLAAVAAYLVDHPDQDVSDPLSEPAGPPTAAALIEAAGPGAGAAQVADEAEQVSS